MFTDSFERKISEKDFSIDKPVREIPFLRNNDNNQNNKFSGIGNPWNVSHYANNTFIADISFKNNTCDIVELPLGNNWTGYKYNSTIDQIYDTRNWCNGTFKFGPDDNNASHIDDDSEFTADNEFQNWTFGKMDYPGGLLTYTFINNFSGNYFDNTHGYNHDALELRMSGYNFTFGNDWCGYSKGDRCWWNSTLEIPRGRLIDSSLEFEVYPMILADFNSWEFKILLNNVSVYTLGTGTLYQSGLNQWYDFSIPQTIWTNTTNVFSGNLNDSKLEISVMLEYIADNAAYNPGMVTNAYYQQLLFDNIKLIVQGEVEPKQLGLKINNTYVNNKNWGEGKIESWGNWDTDILSLNFSCDDQWSLSDFQIELKAKINVFTVQNNPDTNFETNYNSIGTQFVVYNKSAVYWESYAYFSVSSNYQETEMRLNFPEDVNITWISEPQNPSINRLSECINTTHGLLIVPVKDISTTPNGYWKLKGESPNYLLNSYIFKNSTNNPQTGDWVLNSNFFTGDYINITSEVINSPLISSYKTFTKADLKIIFPNGSVWIEQNQFKNLSDEGSINFNQFAIPFNPPNYEPGIYMVVITWNNSYSNYGLNETGVIYDTFKVIHPSVLKSDQNIYYYNEILNSTFVNLKVSFKDRVDNTLITNAQVYTYIKGEMFNFNEISPGFYFLEVNASKPDIGNNTLTICANSTFYLNNKINITLNVVLESNLIVGSNDLTIPIGAPLIFNASYRDLDGKHVENAEITLSYEGQVVDYVENKLEECYICQVDTDELSIGIYEFATLSQHEKYLSKSSLININIRRINTKIQLSTGDSELKVEPKKNFEVSITLKDEDFNKKVKADEVKYTWKFGDGKLKEAKEGVYIGELEGVPEGSYVITITVDAGDNYDFKRYEITLKIIANQQNTIFLQIILIISSIAFAGISIYTIIYKRILKFPKQVRKVRSFMNQLGKKNAPKKKLISQEEAIDMNYQNELNFLSKSLKSISSSKSDNLLIKK